VKQPSSDGFTRIYRHYRAPAVFMPEEVVAAAHSNDLKAAFQERIDKFRTSAGLITRFCCRTMVASLGFPTETFARSSTNA
jgi:hypothetical protein